MGCADATASGSPAPAASHCPVAMFLDWCSGPSAWQAFSVLDVVLALLRSCRSRSSFSRRRVAARPLPTAFSAFSVVAGAVAALLILYRIANQPGPNDAVDVQSAPASASPPPSWSPRRLALRARGARPGRAGAAGRGPAGARSVTEPLARAARRRFT